MVYIRHNIYLTNNQLQKIRSSAKQKQAVTVRIDPTIRPNRHLYLTETQIKKLKDKKPHDITLSKTQLEKNGGFIFSIPAILAGVGAAAGIASSAANIAKAISSKKYENDMKAETLRHNKNVEKLLQKSGRGIYLPGKKNLVKA